MPKKELAGIIKSIEVLDIPDTSEAGIGNRFLPDGFFEIGINLGSDDLKITSTLASEIQLDNPRVYFFGQGTVSSHLFSAGRLHILILKIYPWAASLIFDFDLSDCVDINLDLNMVFGKEALKLEELIMESKGYMPKINLLQHYLIEKIRQRNNSINPILEKSTRLIFQSKGNIMMKELAIECHTTQRTMQRIFRQYYGIKPKQYAQQRRLRYFAAQLSRNKDLNLTQVILQCGYFDQAHFIREFKSIAQTTPSTYFFEKTPLIDDFLEADWTN